MRRRSVTSLVRTWPSTIMRRAATKSIMAADSSADQWTLGAAFSSACPGGSLPRTPRGGWDFLLATAGDVLYRLRSHDGHVAEWLRNGLQNRVPRFNSGRGLQLRSDNSESPGPALPGR